MIMGAMSVALLTAVGCSETETDINPAGGGNNTQAALGINTTIQTGNATKAVVDGAKITYDQGSYTETWCAPGLGVVLTNKDVDGWYNADLSGYGGNHIWFMGDPTGDTWVSKKGAKGTTYDENKTEYNLSTEVGQVFAYYPYDATYNPTTVTQASDLKIPVSLITATATGNDIDAETSNAAKVWDPASGGGAWVNRTPIPGANVLADKTEKDYMYFDGTNAQGTNTGRYVNNGHAGNAASANSNTDEDNPGYGITLTMKHALAMVSFRVYDGGNLGTAGQVEFVGFKIEDNGGTFLNTSNGTMQIADGTLAIEARTGTPSIARTVTNYTLKQQIPAGGTETANTFIEAGDTRGATVSPSVSALVYPVDFTTGSLKLTITLNDGTTDQDYTVNIPGRNWEKGQNYVYTLSAGRNKLSITQVDVQDWHVVNADELPL